MLKVRHWIFIPITRRPNDKGGPKFVAHLVYYYKERVYINSLIHKSLEAYTTSMASSSTSLHGSCLGAQCCLWVFSLDIVLPIQFGLYFTFMDSRIWKNRIKKITIILKIIIKLQNKFKPMNILKYYLFIKFC